MRFAIGLVLFWAWSASHAADNTTAVSRTLEGTKAQFPAKSVAEGVRAVIGALESCHYATECSDPAADLKKAQKGDHVRFVFAKLRKVDVLDKEYEVSELIFANGAFWIRYGDKAERCTKYEFDKFKPFQEWYRQ